MKAHTLREVKQPNATSRCVSGAMEERGDRAKRVRLSKRRKSRASAAKAAVPKGFQRVHPLLSVSGPPIGRRRPRAAALHARLT